MGCHTWYYRPLTEKEFNILKENALEDIEYCFGPSDDPYDIIHYKLALNSFINNVPYIDDYYWYDFGFGSKGLNKGLVTDVTGFIRGHKGQLFISVNNPVKDRPYYEIFRVRNYPLKVIHNRRELRRFLRKKYFDLTVDQLDDISNFFKNNPGGIIEFG